MDSSASGEISSQREHLCLGGFKLRPQELEGGSQILYLLHKMENINTPGEMDVHSPGQGGRPPRDLRQRGQREGERRRGGGEGGAGRERRGGEGGGGGRDQPTLCPGLTAPAQDGGCAMRTEGPLTGPVLVRGHLLLVAHKFPPQQGPGSAHSEGPAGGGGGHQGAPAAKGRPQGRTPGT